MSMINTKTQPSNVFSFPKNLFSAFPFVKLLGIIPFDHPAIVREQIYIPFFMISLLHCPYVFVKSFTVLT